MYGLSVGEEREKRQIKSPDLNEPKVINILPSFIFKSFK